MHESLQREGKPAGGSDRGFGFVMAGAFAVLAGLPLLGGHMPHWWLLAVALPFLGFAWLRPAALAPLNRQWTRFGLLLHRIVSPVMLGAMYYGTVVPMGLAMRAFGRDQLRLKRDPSATSYWIESHPPGPDPKSMPQQY